MSHDNETRHADDCFPEFDCIDCGGCECGRVPAQCDAPGCMSQADAEQYAYEYGEDGGEW